MQKTDFKQEKTLDATGRVLVRETYTEPRYSFIYKYMPEHDRRIFEHAVESMGV